MFKKNRVLLSLLFILGVSSTLIVKGSLNDYFPHTSGSFWIYEDQDRNKLTRRTIDVEDCLKMKFRQLFSLKTRHNIIRQSTFQGKFGKR